MRDDCLGGSEQVRPVFEDLYNRSAFDIALVEKANATVLWSEIVKLTASLQASIADSTANGGEHDEGICWSVQPQLNKHFTERRICV